jgi:hypothetical protein
MVIVGCVVKAARAAMGSPRPSGTGALVHHPGERAHLGAQQLAL